MVYCPNNNNGKMYPEDENVDYNGALVTELLAQTLCGLSVNQLTKQPMVSALVSRTSKNPVANHEITST